MASLQERYPAVCEACAPGVQARLQRNNYLAKSTALGHWLNTSPTQAVKSANPLLSYLQLFVWMLRGCLWISASVSMLFWHVVGAYCPAVQQICQHEQFSASLSHSSCDTFGVLTLPIMTKMYALLRSWLPITILGALWTPYGALLIRQPQAKLNGREEYIKLQIFIQVLRLINVYVLSRLALSVDIYGRIQACLALLSVLHLLASFFMLSVSNPVKLNLRDTSSDLKDYVAQRRESPLDEVIFEPLPPSRPSSDQAHHEDTMDWQASDSPTQPSLPLTTSPFSRLASTKLHIPTTIPLARQKFFAPEKPTGLESLFSAAVRLDDEPLLVRSMKSVQRAPGRAIAWTLLILSNSLFALDRWDQLYTIFCGVLISGVRSWVQDRSVYSAALLLAWIVTGCVHWLDLHRWTSSAVTALMFLTTTMQFDQLYRVDSRKRKR